MNEKTDPTEHAYTCADIDGELVRLTPEPMHVFFGYELWPYLEALHIQLKAAGVVPRAYRVYIEAIPDGERPFVGPGEYRFNPWPADPSDEDDADDDVDPDPGDVPPFHPDKWNDLKARIEQEAPGVMARTHEELRRIVFPGNKPDPMLTTHVKTSFFDEAGGPIAAPRIDPDQDFRDKFEGRWPELSEEDKAREREAWRETLDPGRVDPPEEH